MVACVEKEREREEERGIYYFSRGNRGGMGRSQLDDECEVGA
jgi:hypothetical protein